MSKNLTTASEAAAILGIPMAVALYHVRQKHVKAQKLSRFYLVDPDDLARAITKYGHQKHKNIVANQIDQKQ